MIHLNLVIQKDSFNKFNKWNIRIEIQKRKTCFKKLRAIKFLKEKERKMKEINLEIWMTTIQMKLKNWEEKYLICEIMKII